MEGHAVKPKADPVWKHPRRLARYGYLRLMRIEGSPRGIARGLALGVFVGLLPIVPLHMVTALGLAYIFKGSKVAAVLGTWVSNPLDMVPLYLLAYYVGRALAPFNIPALDTSRLSLSEMFSDGLGLILVMLTGGFLIALPAALITYFAALKAVRRYQAAAASRINKT